jgi:hypothetical protein
MQSGRMYSNGPRPSCRRLPGNPQGSHRPNRGALERGAESRGPEAVLSIAGSGPPAATRIAATSPFEGETGVSVTRETIVRFSSPLSADPLTTERFYAEFGGRRLLSRVELSVDRRTATLFYLEQLPAGARVQVMLDGHDLEDISGQPLDADGDGQPGGRFELGFSTSSTSALPGTAVIGTVYASEQHPDGSNIPLRGVTITVDGAEETLRAVTDAEGHFRLEPAPAGRFFVHLDGRTAVGSQWPTGGYYPFVGKAWEAVAGRDDNLAGGTGEIYLPYVPADALLPVSAIETTVVTFPASVLATNPDWAEVRIEVPPNALFSDQGTRGGRVGIAPVPPDRLPEPLPPGLSLPLVITIQTDGPENFDTPVPVRFPNLPDPVTGMLLGPGAKTVLWSFNHDTGRWEAQGLATITQDGLYAVTDPGVGVLQPGWHGVAPATPGEGPEGDGSDEPDCGAYDARCCGDWEDVTAPCAPKKETALDSIKDLAVDDVVFLLGGSSGCGIGAALSASRAARDCARAGPLTGDCLGIVRNADTSARLGCLPGIGSALGLAWGMKGMIDAAIDYRGCLDTAAAACLGAPGRALARSDLGTGDPRLLRALQALETQERFILEVQAALGMILGNPRWVEVAAPEDYPEHQAFMAKVQDAVDPSGPGGVQVTAEERAALLAWPPWNGASDAELLALLTRLEAVAGGTADSALRAELAAGFDLLAAAVAEIEADGGPAISTASSGRWRSS